jgi:predicted enzyme related to lactoylglutathione lyase
MTVAVDNGSGPGFRWVELAASESSSNIALAIPRGGMWRSVGGDTNISLTCADIDVEHDRLRDLGVDVDQDVLRIPGLPPMFRFRDPFGNILQILAVKSG